MEIGKIGIVMITDRMGTCLDETPERPKVWLVQLAPNIWEKIMYYPPK
jgi:hypothetical protein